MKRRLESLEQADERQQQRVRIPTPPRVLLMLRDRLDAGHYQHLPATLKAHIRRAAAAVEGKQ